MTLYIVATPIGNLQDLTERAREILCTVPLVLAEDTRVSARLLAHLGARPRVVALHHHTSEPQIQKIIQEIERAGRAALVTDAGTPGISDPGNIFVAAILSVAPETKIIPIPGASSLTTALSISGFPTDRFRMLGFPPHKNKRQKFFTEVADTKEVVVLFESVHRIKKTLGELAAAVGERPLVVARELTKIYETVYRGTAAEILQNIPASATKGEFVIVIAAR